MTKKNSCFDNRTILYGLFRCNFCGKEQLRRVPFFIEPNERVVYDCNGVWLDSQAPWRCPIICGGQMLLDARYNFAGLLAGELTINPQLPIIELCHLFDANGFYWTDGFQVLRMPEQQHLRPFAQ